MRGKAAALLVAVAVLATGCGGAGPGDSGLGEAIGVTGNWTMEVLNADGSLDRRVEFENAFVGANLLADLLSAAETVGGWSIQAAPGGGPALCSTGSGGCTFPATATTDGATDELVLTGEFSPEFSGEVTEVFANVVIAETGGNRTFSAKDLTLLEGPSGAVPVAAGQTVLVEIRYSFD